MIKIKALLVINMDTVATTTTCYHCPLKWECKNSLALHERSLFGDQITEKEKILITLSKNSPASIDELSIYTKLTIRELTSFLLELELDGRVERVTGGKFIVR